ncbi:MAG: 50S ribosomal protein L9 [Nitrospiraceae bacterium]|jgi:large subunit ribosomal protein L9|nr:50S ribosomal protein L9 [Nitrospiraceae bacterium]
MNVILKEDVKNLGKMGDVVTVKEGYARNFLFPKGLAVEANEKNVKALEHTKRQILDRAKKIKTDAETMAAKFAGKTITITAKAGEEEKLFGSVTTADIAEALKKDGHEVDKKKIHLEEPIRRLGTYTVSVKVHPEVSADVTVQVVAE